MPRATVAGPGWRAGARCTRVNVYPGIPSSTSTYVSPPPPACGSTCSTRRSAGAIRLEYALEGAFERQAVRVLSVPRERRLAQSGPCPLDRRRKRRRLRARGDGAVDALLDELGRGVLRPRDDDDRHTLRSRLDHDEAVALPLRRQDEALGRGERVVEHSTFDEAGCADASVEAARGDRLEDVRPIGAVSEDLALQAGDPGQGGHERRHALLREVASCKDRDRVRCAWPLRRRRTDVLAFQARRRQARCSQALLVEARKAEGSLRDAEARALDAPAELARDGPGVASPVRPSPDLVPVDDDPKPGALARRARGKQ